MTTYTEFLGGGPVDEACAQIGAKSYDASALNKLECEAYIVALKRVHGDPPPGCKLLVQRREHDFGDYYDVILRYDNRAAALDYCAKVELGLSVWREAGMRAPVDYGPPGSPPIAIRHDPAEWILEDAANAKPPQSD